VSSHVGSRFCSVCVVVFRLLSGFEGGKHCVCSVFDSVCIFFRNAFASLRFAHWPLKPGAVVDVCRRSCSSCNLLTCIRSSSTEAVSKSRSARWLERSCSCCLFVSVCAWVCWLTFVSSWFSLSEVVRSFCSWSCIIPLSSCWKGASMSLMWFPNCMSMPFRWGFSTLSSCSLVITVFGSCAYAYACRTFVSLSSSSSSSS